MRAVNLIPRENRRSAVTTAGLSLSPAYLLPAALVLAVALVSVLVLTNNTISQRQTQLTSMRTELARDQAVAARLAAYQRFAQLAKARVTTVRDILATRFDWHGALEDLSKVVPTNTSLQSLNATVAPNTGSSSSPLRGAITAPAFDLTGCTKTQDDVARLMSRLRVMDGVTRVSLQSSTDAQGGSGSSSSTSGSSASCGNGPTFHVVVWFTPPATSNGATASTGGVG